jgi:hypothetical protein
MDGEEDAMLVNRKLLLELVVGPDSQIARYWDSEKGSLEASLAVVVRAFMTGNRILDAREGVRLFFALHPERLVRLAGALSPAISSAPAPRLAA